MPRNQVIRNELSIDSNTGPSSKVSVPGTLSRVIFFALISVISLTAIRFGTVEPWWEAAFESAVFALGALSVIDCSRIRGCRLKGLALLAPLLALSGFAYFQTIPLWPGNRTAGHPASVPISVDAYATWLWTLYMLALIVTAGLLFRYINSARRLWILVHTLIAIGVSSGIFGVVRHVVQSAGVGGDSGFVFAVLGPDIGYGQFLNQNHFALMMEMTLGLLLGVALLGVKRRLYLPIYFALATIVWVALVLTRSRGGIFAMLCEILVLAFVFVVVRARRVRVDKRSVRYEFGRRVYSIVAQSMLALLLVVVIIFGVAWVGGDPLATRFERLPRQFGVQTDNREKGRRIDIWQATWAMIKSNPIAGVGFGAYPIAIPKYHDASGQSTPQKAHNDYFELLAGGGLIALAIFVWFIIVLVRRVRTRLKLSDGFGKAACVGALAGLCGVAVHSIVDFGLHITVNAIFCMALIVILTTDVSEAVTTSSPR